MALVVKNLPASSGEAEDTSLIPGSGRSPEAGNGNPLPYSCLEDLTEKESAGLQSTGYKESNVTEELITTHTHTHTHTHTLTFLSTP